MTDQGEARGIEITNALRSRIQDMANNCQPPVVIDLKKYGNILIVHVPEGKDKPYQCADGFFIRMGSNAQKMNRDRIVEFLQTEGKVRFEEQVHKKFNFKKDYSPAKLAGYLKLAGITPNLDDTAILTNLGMAETAGASVKMKNAGVLFFTESVRLLCEQATITCAVFDGTERVHVLNRKDYDEDIITNINSALHPCCTALTLWKIWARASTKSPPWLKGRYAGSKVDAVVKSSCRLLGKKSAW